MNRRDRRILRTGLFLFCTVVSGFLLCACRSDDSEDAVECAREYALRNLRGITETQRDFIRYTQPAIYSNLLQPRIAMQLSDPLHIKIDDVNRLPTTPVLDKMHACMVWAPPDLGAKVVVAGYGLRNMRHWEPVRVLVKRYEPGETAFLNAVAAGVDYARNNMLYLTRPEQNRVRYSEPEIRLTKLPVTPSAKPERDLSDWDAYLEDLRGKHEQRAYTQISLVWRGDKPDEYIVITGFSTSGTLAGWKLKTGELMTGAKLNAASLPEGENLRMRSKMRGGMVFPAEETVDRNPQEKGSENSGRSIYYR